MKSASLTTSRPDRFIRLRVAQLAAVVVVVVALPAGTGVFAPAHADVQIADVRDTLDTAVRGPSLYNGVDDPAFDVYGADHEQFDNNVFRLPNSTDVKTTIGRTASRQDHINSPSAGLDSQWVIGRQTVEAQLRADDNRYSQNTNLDNVSTNDKLAWNWGLGSVLFGQVGVDYTRALLSYVNAQVYNRNTYQQSQFFAAGRYQVGPRWALYGGILDTNLNVEDRATQANNFRRKAVDMGTELATSAQDTFGVDYRYTDARYPNAILLASAAFDPDYREDRLRFLAKRALTEKTTVDVSAGYLRRDYGNTVIGAFSGPIWRAALGWQPTEKTQLMVSTWRDLQSYLTDQTNYYRTTGVSVAPTWIPSEKITLSLLVSREAQSFIGSSTNVQNQLARRGTSNSQLLNLTYAPIRALTCDASFVHEQRGSNELIRAYNDGLATAGVRFMFQ
jgi:exopolysaccharide biosynthesis operon protein EpsL